MSMTVHRPDGLYDNEHPKGRRDDVVVATKFGLVSYAGAGPGVIDSDAHRDLSAALSYDA